MVNILLNSACIMETIPPGLGLEPSYATANVTLTKALPVQSCWSSDIPGALL